MGSVLTDVGRHPAEQLLTTLLGSLSLYVTYARHRVITSVELSPPILERKKALPKRALNAPCPPAGSYPHTSPDTADQGQTKTDMTDQHPALTWNGLERRKARGAD